MNNHGNNPETKSPVLEDQGKFQTKHPDNNRFIVEPKDKIRMLKSWS